MSTTCIAKRRSPRIRTRRLESYAAHATLVTSTLLLLGCSTILPQRNPYERLNPPNITYDDGTISARSDGAIGYIQTQRQAFQKVMYEDYYAALSCVLGKAEPTPKPTFICPGGFGPDATSAVKQERISAYLVQGVNTVKANCRRWFNSMAVAQQRQAFDSSNENVLKAFGHTFLGITNANPVTITAAGAMDTAYTGFTGNYSQAFLAAPNAKNVEAHIMQVLEKAANDMRAKLSTATNPYREPSDAVVWIEGDFAGYCSQKSARDITDTALRNTQSAPGENGTINTLATKVAEDQATNVLKDQVQSLDKSLKNSLQTINANNDKITTLQGALNQTAASTQSVVDTNKKNEQRIAELQKALDDANRSLLKLQSAPQPAPAASSP